ncbi:MAG: alanine--tRNA ligase, partial [Bacilli bacterium]|nr:alanine--tRNA ligase [Bacilli bacterium]
ISGDDAFKLYDTYGFPIELSQEMAADANLKIDMNRFNELMEHQKELGRAAFNEDSNFSKQSADLLAFEEHSEFIGYDKTSCEAKVIGLFKDGIKVDTLNGIGEVIFDNTVFYAESGGQINDRGTIIINNNEYEVLNVRKAPHSQHLHQIDAKNIKENDMALLKIDVNKRNLTARNHTATHLLHQALKDIVGTHVNQAGSYVSDEYLRFDFNHYEKVSDEDLNKIEEQVNNEIFKGSKVNISFMNINEAKEKGAMALFDDKYGDIVRVIEIPHISIELCGGTHVNQIEDIGLFKIEKEESVGSGIRRIIARTSKGAYDLLNVYLNDYQQVKDIVKAKDLSKVIDRTNQIKEDLSNANNEIKKLKEVILKNNSSSIEAITIKDVEIYLTKLAEVSVNEMKDVVSNYQNQYPNGLVIAYNDKNYVVGLGKELLVKDYSAKDIALLINKEFNGKGGGKADKAQGGISININEDKLLKVLENNL